MSDIKWYFFILSLFSFFTGMEIEAAPVSREEVRADPSDRFSVWVSRLDGSHRSLLLSDARRQITHTRVSPDREWVVFTTYNDPGKDGFARENGNYNNTEIRLLKLDGTVLKTVVPPQKGIMNCNASFSTDGERLIFMSSRDGSGAPSLYWHDLKSGLTAKVPTPPSLRVLTDPHEVKNKIAFPARTGGGELQGIWTMNRDGSDLKQVSFPKKSSDGPKEDLSQGDYDPRLSPDLSTLALFRNVGGAFHVVLIDIASGVETDLTGPLFPERKQTAEGVAAWSSDGKRLIFRHIALPREGPQRVGLYTMKPDGSERVKIPIAKGEFPHVQPEFFPEGSTSETRIIYQTEKNPNFNF